MAFLTRTTTRAYRGSVASQAAMLALTADISDWVTRSDLSGQIFELTALPSSSLSNWESYPVGSGGGGGDMSTDALWDAVGDLPVGTGPNTATRLPMGVANQVLAVNSGGTNLQWSTPASAGSMATDTLWDAAGDLAVGTGANTGTRLPLGTALQTLRVNSGATGVEWAATTAGVTVQEEGVSLSTAGTTLNFVGTGVTASGTSTTKTITVTAAVVQDALTGGSTTLAPSVNATATGLYQTAPTMLPNAVSALALDMLRAVNTKTITVNSTFTFGTAPATNTYVSWLLTNGGATDLTVTLPASVKSTTTQATISSFVLPAYAVADMALRYDGTYYWLAGEPMTLPVGFTWSLIGTATDRVYTAVLKSPFAFKITSVTSKCTSGTATATVRIDTTALGGTANAVSSSESTQAHTTANNVAADQDVTITFTASSTPVDPLITIAGYRL
jgi:hypothetical protein